MTFGRRLFVLVIFLFLHCNLFAQEVTSRKYYQAVQDVFFTELVYPQEEGELQISCTPGYKKSDEANQFSLPFLVEYGITDRWQVELSWNSFENRFSGSESTARGIGNLEVGTQFSFMNVRNSSFHAACGFEVEVPLGNEELSEDSWEYAPYILGALDLPSVNNSQLFAKAGIGFLSEAADKNELNFSGGVFVPFNKVVITSELSWWGNFKDENNENQFFFTPGVIINLPGAWETGVGIPVRLNKKSDKFMILAVLTFEFGLMDNDE